MSSNDVSRRSRGAHREHGGRGVHGARGGRHDNRHVSHVPVKQQSYSSQQSPSMQALANDNTLQEILYPKRPKKKWYSFAMPLIGKLVRCVSRLLHHGGSALPGKIVEQLDPGFLARTLGALPYGVVLVSGTNGKTTTTRMVASMLRDAGLRVFTNPTGSNFTRGVVASLTQAMPVFGKLKADIAVLELDEAYAVHFVKQISPRYALLLNVMRDQLDRFGEIDTTAHLLGNVARATTRTLVLNREDTRVRALADVKRPSCDVRYFGLEDDVRAMFPTDDDLHASGEHSVQKLPEADVTLAGVGDRKADFVIAGKHYHTSVKLDAAYNMFNAAAATAIVRAIVNDIVQERENGKKSEDEVLVKSIAQLTPAFGRGEVIDVNGVPVELVLVKNPIGFRLALASHRDQDTMIAICDEYADGRDMSWLWDVDFTMLKNSGVSMVSGTRAWDMALRLGYDGVPVQRVNTSLEDDVREFVQTSPAKLKAKRLYCTYTSMLRARAVLSQVANVRDAGVGK